MTERLEVLYCLLSCKEDEYVARQCFVHVDVKDGFQSRVDDVGHGLGRVDELHRVLPALNLNCRSTCWMVFVGKAGPFWLRNLAFGVRICSIFSI